MSRFSEREFLRYSRHLQLPQIGSDGQLKLRQARVLVVGCGGLGAPVSLYLAAAGIGEITLLDGDTVELSNLQRQVTFTESDIGSNKALCTARALRERNSDIRVNAIPENLATDNCEQPIQQTDIVLDCTDSVPTRYLINDICHKLNKPWVYASVYQFSGQCAVFRPGKACYRCLFPDAASQAIDCSSAGVLGVLPGIMGTLQASMAIDVLLDRNPTDLTRLFMFEAADLGLQYIDIPVSPDCITCNALSDLATPAVNEMQCEMNQANNNASSITAALFNEQKIDPGIVVIDVRDAPEHEAFNLADRCHTHLHIPSAELADRLEDGSLKLDRDKQYLLYCQAGIRSATACEAMCTAGFNARSLAGGLQALLQRSN